MNHPNTKTLEKIYADFAAGNFASMMESCHEKATFQVAGKSIFAGKFERSTFITSFLKKMKDLSHDTLKVEVHEILASDRHGLVLTTESLIREGKKIEYRTVHVWRIEDGRPVAWYQYPRDQYQFDTIWSADGSLNI